MRAARGWLLAVSSAGLAIAAHAAASGGMPDTAVTVVVTALLGFAATGTARKIRSPRGVLGTLAVGQLLMHGALTVLDTHPDAGTHFPTGAMLAAHVVATLLTAALLAHADRALATVDAALRRLLPVLIVPAPPVATPAPVVVSDDPRGITDLLLRRVHTRRGPPACS